MRANQMATLINISGRREYWEGGMSTKDINNSSYATSGYAVDGVNQNITIGPDGTIGGPGVTGGSTEAYTILNLGTITGTSDAITLGDGGIVTNGSESDTGALLDGGN